MPENSSKKTIVFAGGGHAHLYSLRRTIQLTEQGYDVVLINPSRFLYYSGMAPGLVSRIYRPEQDRIDVKYLVEKGGGRFIKDRIYEIKSKEQEVVLDSGEVIHYDAMSVCLGSHVPGGVFAAAKDHIMPVKPVENMEEIHWGLLDLKENGHKPRVLVVGGGPGGCEMAANTRQLFDDHDIDGEIMIADANDTLLKSAPKKAQKTIEDFLRSRGIDILFNSRIVALDRERAYTKDGRKIDFDMLILAVGIVPPDIFRRSGLATADDGGLWVNHYMQSITDPRIFGGGDSVAFRGKPLTRLGVFAIRQGPVIFNNIQALLKGEPMEAFRPQELFLYILNLGDRTGLMVYGPISGRSSLIWKLKNMIDVKFMKEFQYPEDNPGELKAYFDRLTPEEAADLGKGIVSNGRGDAATETKAAVAM